MRRAIACVWPRLFWLHAFGAHADAHLDAPLTHCDARCRAQLAALGPSDAFGTLMMLLRNRLPRNGSRAAAAAPVTAAGTAVGAAVGAAGGVETFAGADASWMTNAASCVQALRAGESDKS
eukprot:4477868-Pleurochrysis_carterae.AAC.1